MKNFRPWAGVLLAALAVNAPTQAQETQQTVEGAQTFLSTLAESQAIYLKLHLKGSRFLRYNCAPSIYNSRDGKGRIVSSRPSCGNIAENYYVSEHNLDRFVDISFGKTENLCVTSIHINSFGLKGRLIKSGNFVPFSISSPYSKDTEDFVDPAPYYEGPFLIDWGKVTFDQLPTMPGWIIAKNGGNGPNLAFQGADKETHDRIEYALKFLKASCDRAASTGF